MTIAAMPVDRADGAAAGHHAAGRQRPRGRLPGEAADRRGTGHGPHRPGLDRRPRHRQPRPRLPGQHGHLPVQPRHAGRRAHQDRLPRLRQGDLSGVDPHAPRAGPPVRRLLGRHRHDPVVLRGEPGLAAPDPPFDLASADGADLHPGPVPAALAARRRDDPQQPDRRRLRDRGGRGRSRTA